MVHQQLDAEADGVGLPGVNPALHMLQQRRPVLFEDGRAHLVADGPVVHIGQKALHRGHAGIKVPKLLQQEGVQAVLLIICVRQFVQKRFRLLAAPQLLRQGPQSGGPHAQDRPGGNVREQLRRKGGEGRLRQGNEAALYRRVHGFLPACRRCRKAIRACSSPSEGSSPAAPSIARHVILSERSESKDLIPRQPRPYPAWKILRLRRMRLRSG